MSDVTVKELISSLKRMMEANGREMDYYNSDEAMDKMDVHSRTATIKGIAADNRWINFILYNIAQGLDFCRKNDKELPR